jgi:hypothetical protein
LSRDEENKSASDVDFEGDYDPALDQAVENDDMLTSDESDGTDEVIRRLDPLAEIIYLNPNP